jgi:hypothetical protein
MRKVLIWTGVVVLAIGLGVGGAAGAGALMSRAQERVRISRGAPSTGEQTPPDEVPFLGRRGTWGQGMMPGLRNSPRGGDGSAPYGGFGNMPGGMMIVAGLRGQEARPRGAAGCPSDRAACGAATAPSSQSGERITLDAAVQSAQAYAAKAGDGLKVAEVMEFDRNFYALLVEKETGRGAIEILIDPYSGAVSPEPGPNMMWNLKYGHMGRALAQTEDNTLTLDEARAKAQAYLDVNRGGATLAEGGMSFYGYYTLDYLVDGKPAGMLSDNGLTGQVWVHNWHGTFVAEKELES